MHALTTRAGVDTPRFQRAIALYSGYVPMTSNFQQENATETFYKHLNVSSLAEAREASSEAVILANAEVIGRSAYSHFPFGPVVDGILIPQHPSISFLNGGFNKDVQIMTGHSVNEAVTFAPPYVETDEEFGQFLRGLYPTIRDPVVDYVTEELYPGQGANRTIDFVSDNGMKCNTDYLRRAYDRQTYGYEFRIPPSFHGGDFPYYFYNGPDPEDGAAGLPSVARMLQRYIINFVKNGDPNSEGLDEFPPAGEGSLMLAITGDGNTVERDATDSEQCRWLQKILYG
jgi:carboxylesterase type B